MGFKRVIIAIALILIIASVLFFLPDKEYTFEDFYFDTYVTGKIYSRNPLPAKAAINEIKDEFKRIDLLKIQGLRAGIVDTTTVRIIEKSLYFSEKTEGYFDITIDPILKKWNYFKEPTLPSQNEIEQLLPLVDYRKVKLKADTLLIPDFFSINLGGSAKGYALNRAKNILERYGIRSALIEAGGDILLAGKKKGKKNWIIGIRNPREENEIIGTLSVHDCFVFTSGDYERYFIIDGKRYHHIVNPFTGYPAKEVASVTVTVKDGVEGDCVTTALVAMGIDKAKNYITNNNLEAIIVDTSENIYKFMDKKKFNIYE
jgi:thiamine biosynthesis lipoprotein